MPWQDLPPTQTTQTLWAKSDLYLHRWTMWGMTYNHLYFIIILRSLPKDESQPPLYNIHLSRHVSVRHMCDFMRTSTYIMGGLPYLNIHPNLKQKESIYSLGRMSSHGFGCHSPLSPYLFQISFLCATTQPGAFSAPPRRELMLGRLQHSLVEWKANTWNGRKHSLFLYLTEDPYPE